ncbi:barstar family protein [Nocardia asteroides]|uniref:barstar family protein n=1 Tax=Nocardia asteroides TaxID=1824 RepID=UPI00366790E8
MTEDPAGRLVVTLDLDGVTDKAGLMERCARDLALPDWFGRNWDALADSLSDPSVWPPEARERGLVLRSSPRPPTAGRGSSSRSALEVPPRRLLTSLDDLPGGCRRRAVGE